MGFLFADVGVNAACADLQIRDETRTRLDEVVAHDQAGPSHNVARPIEDPSAKDFAEELEVARERAHPPGIVEHDTETQAVDRGAIVLRGIKKEKRTGDVLKFLRAPAEIAFGLPRHRSEDGLFHPGVCSRHRAQEHRAHKAGSFFIWTR